MTFIQLVGAESGKVLALGSRKEEMYIFLSPYFLVPSFVTL